MAFVLQRERRLDVLVNNAGIGYAGSIEDTSIQEREAQLETEFFGVHRVCRSVLPVMRKQGSGLIVNISWTGCLSSMDCSQSRAAIMYAGTPARIFGVSTANFVCRSARFKILS